MHTSLLPTNRGGPAGFVSVARSKPRVEAVPFDQWPLWARVIAKFRRADDLGLGDTVVHLIGDARSEHFQKWFARKFRRSCGCTDRQRWLNRRFPYTGEARVGGQAAKTRDVCLKASQTQSK